MTQNKVAVPKASLEEAALNARESIKDSFEKDYPHNAAAVSEAIGSAMKTLARTDNSGGEFVSISEEDVEWLAAFTTPDSSDTLRDMLEHYNYW